MVIFQDKLFEVFLKLNSTYCVQPEANVSMTEYQKGVVMEKVHEVQKTITHIIDVCDDALCSICGQRTYLPLVYHENLLQAKSLMVR